MASQCFRLGTARPYESSVLQGSMFPGAPYYFKMVSLPLSVQPHICLASCIFSTWPKPLLSGEETTTSTGHPKFSRAEIPAEDLTCFSYQSPPFFQPNRHSTWNRPSRSNRLRQNSLQGGAILDGQVQSLRGRQDDVHSWDDASNRCIATSNKCLTSSNNFCY